MARDSLFIILKNLGLLLQFIAPVPLLLLPAAWYYDELHAFPAILGTFAIFIVAGLVLARVPTTREPRLREGMLIAAAAWLLVPLGSITVFLTLEGWSWVDAYFETMSAWTGTGMTLARVTELSRTTLLWRSVMQWIGGLGVIVLTLVILARPGTGAHTLYASEGREDRLRPSVVSTVRTMWWIYLVYTLLSIGLLMAAGMVPWEALNHAMTGISTAGMSVREGSIGEYDDPGIEAAVIVIMLMGAIAFVAHYALLRGRWRRFVGDVQFVAMWVVILLAFPVVLWVLLSAGLGEERSLREAAFQTVSAVTSTGFQTAPLDEWPAVGKVFLAGVLLLGGAAGSTAGGIKLFRGVLLLRGTLWKLERSGHPHFAVTSFRFGGKKLTEREANEAFAEAAFISFLWVVLVFVSLVGLLMVLPADEPLVDVIFDVASAASNNGLAVGVVLSHLGDAGKLAMVGVMWAGRLEILPVLLLLREMVRLGKR